MKYRLLFLLLLSLTATSFSQNPYWEWSKAAYSSTGNMEDRPISIVSDNEDFIYSAGHFKSSSMMFDTIALSNVSESVSSDVFLAKYSPLGEIIWAKSFGGQSYEWVADMAVDANGDLYMTGQFRSDTFSIGQTTLINNGVADIFLFKVNPQGEVLWAKNIGGTTEDQGVALAVDLLGNVILVSDFESPSITLGTETVSNSVFSGYSKDILICKYDGDGNLIWAKTLKGDSADNVSDVAVDLDGNIIVSGRFNSPVLTDGEAIMTNDKVVALFVMKYSASGAFLWSDSWAGSSSNNGRSVSTDAEGNIILLANLGDTLMTFGSITLTCDAKSSAIVKYDQNGNSLWATICAEATTRGASVATDLDGNIFLATHFMCQNVHFGGDVFYNNYGGYDILFIKYDKGGNEIWGIHPEEGNSDDICTSIYIDKRGDAVLAGYFLSDALTFGGTILNHESSLQASTFVAKVNTASTVSIGNSFGKAFFSAYPNPTSGSVQLTLDSEFETGQVTVFNEIGGLIYSQTIEDVNDANYKLPGASGLYFLQIFHPEGYSHTLKVIKQ